MYACLEWDKCHYYYIFVSCSITFDKSSIAKGLVILFPDYSYMLTRPNTNFLGTPTKYKFYILFF